MPRPRRHLPLLLTQYAASGAVGSGWCCCRCCWWWWCWEGGGALTSGSAVCHVLGKKSWLIVSTMAPWPLSHSPANHFPCPTLLCLRCRLTSRPGVHANNQQSCDSQQEMLVFKKQRRSASDAPSLKPQQPESDNCCIRPNEFGFYFTHIESRLKLSRWVVGGGVGGSRNGEGCCLFSGTASAGEAGGAAR